MEVFLTLNFEPQNFESLGAGNLLSVAIPRALLSLRLLWDFHYHQG